MPLYHINLLDVLEDVLQGQGQEQYITCRYRLVPLLFLLLAISLAL
jgi:hypothetical protein